MTEDFKARMERAKKSILRHVFSQGFHDEAMEDIARLLSSLEKAVETLEFYCKKKNFDKESSIMKKGESVGSYTFYHSAMAEDQGDKARQCLKDLGVE